MSAPNSVTGALSQVAIQALPPDIQNLLNQKGKTSDRIKAAINWASRPDPRVLLRHQKRDQRQLTDQLVRIVGHSMSEPIGRTVSARYAATRARSRCWCDGQ